MEQLIRWGFLGCGDVVARKSGMGFVNADSSCVTAVMRRDIDKAKQSAEAFGAENYYAVEDELINDPAVDAIYIATPPGLHYQQALKCCEAGKPVYIEKPFARNYTEAKEITERFAEKGVPLFVAHYRRALPRFIQIKQMLDEGVIGELYEARYRLSRAFHPELLSDGWQYHVPVSGGGIFHDIAPHSVDIMVFLLGNMVQLGGHARNCNPSYPVEDLVVMSFTTDKAVVGTAHFNLNAREKRDCMMLYGEKGTIQFSMHGNDPIVLTTQAGVFEYEKPMPEYIEGPMVQTVVDDLLGRGTCPCTGQDALETVRVMDQVVDAYYGGRKDDFWNHPERWNQVH